jgi:hypothetical protein
MNQLIKLHLGLAKYLINELPKKKTLREVIKFLKPLLGVYITELVKLYKSLFLVFDVEYQKQKKQFDKMQKIKIDLKKCLKMLQFVDDKMKKSGIPNWKRKQFWRDFYRDGQVRKDTFDELLKEINQIR